MMVLLALLALSQLVFTSGAANATHVYFDVATVTTDSAAVSIAGRVVTITAPGTYRLSGQLHGGRLVVAPSRPGPVTLLLDGLSVFASSGPALVMEGDYEVTLHLLAGSFNSLFDGWQRLPGEAGAALHAAAPLTIDGEGHLLVMARLKHGVLGTSAVVVNGGVLTVVAADDGVRGEDLTVNGGELLVFAANDAIKATGEAEGAGVVALNGGTLDLVAQGDGVQAERRLEVRGGAVRVVAGGGHTVAPGDASTKGLKAGVELLITDGVVEVSASDDAVHSDGDLWIGGGLLTLATGDDAVHADGALLVSGGAVEVTASWEGLEGAQVIITGGSVVVWADDDAVNAAGDAPTEELVVAVRGGHLVLSAGSDAIDSNGGVEMTGGTVVLNGPFAFAKPAIDRHVRHTVLLAGATIVAGGTLVQGRDASVAVGSTQGVVYLDLAGLLPAGSVLALRGAEGDIATFRAPRDLARMSFTSPAVTPGTVYELRLGGVPMGAELRGGLFQPAGAVGGELLGSFRAR